MKNVLRKLFGKQNVSKETEKIQPTETISKPKYDFVEQYTLIDPSRVMCDYSLWSGCQFVPVAYETTEEGTGFSQCVQLPTNVFLNYLVRLEEAPEEVRKNKKMRTVSIIKLQNGKKAYILPNLKEQNIPTLYTETKKTLPFDVTPEINRAIVDQLKIYTR